MKNGKVKFYLKDKGYGFITDDETGKDVFFHKSLLNSDVEKNDIVRMEFRSSLKGPEATKIEVP